MGGDKVFQAIAYSFPGKLNKTKRISLWDDI